MSKPPSEEILKKAHRMCNQYRHAEEVKYCFRSDTLIRFVREIIKMSVKES